jgi:malonyl CoA-acyl carrier protein transacylase
MKSNTLVAIVGLGAILPDAVGVEAFWQNILNKKYSITEVPQGRWEVADYYDPDPQAPDKTYSKIGGWVQDYDFDPLKAGMAIPPRVLAMMDKSQQWAIAASRQALQDYGYPARPLNGERVAVILGNAMGGENHLRTSLRICLPEYLQVLKASGDFRALPENTRVRLEAGLREGIRAKIPAITEDTMPGELSNIIAGRVANIFNFTGPNFITDAACASSLAALQASVEGLLESKFDAVLTGGIDHNMGPETFVKFCKIGALSADGSRPYAAGANGFVMGEGAVIFLLKRLDDAEQDGDKIYAVVHGIGGSSDGKGKGITAPNPLGQQRAIERAWSEAGIPLSRAGLIEGHGTSTEVGDMAELESLLKVFGSLGLPGNSLALGSVKSNIGHLKSAAGAAGLLKTVLALHHRILPPSINYTAPNPRVDLLHSPLYVNVEAQEWRPKDGGRRYAGISSFGFGGTNFHVVIGEHGNGKDAQTSGARLVLEEGENGPKQEASVLPSNQQADRTVSSRKNPGTTKDAEETRKYVLAAVSEKTGYPPEMLDPDLDLEADLGVDTVKQAELFAQIRTHYNISRREDLRLADYNTLNKIVAFIQNSGQGDDPEEDKHHGRQEMDAGLAIIDPAGSKPYQGLLFVSASTSAELMSTLQKRRVVLAKVASLVVDAPSQVELARPERLVIDHASREELARRIEKAITALGEDSPAIWKALQAQGIYRSHGEAGKLAFLFPGQGSQYVNMLQDLRDIEPVVKQTIEEADAVMEPLLGRSLSSYLYAEGSAPALAQAEDDLKNTAITQPAMLTADVAILRLMATFGFRPDVVIGHSLGEYAALVAAGVLTFAEALEVVSARGREMTRIEVADNGSMAAVSAPLEKVEEILQGIAGYVVIANVNSPLQSVIGGETEAVEKALAAFKAAGFEGVKIPVSHAFHTKIVAPASLPLRQVITRMNVKPPSIPIVANVTGELYPSGREEILDILAGQVASPVLFVKGMQKLYALGARVFVEVGPKRVLSALAADNLKDKQDVLILATNHPRKGGRASFHEALCGLYAAGIKPASKPAFFEASKPLARAEKETFEIVATPTPEIVDSVPITGSVVISGAGLGLPGRNANVFADDNIASLLRGEMRIEPIPQDTREGMLEKRIVRLVKSEAGAEIEEISTPEQTLQLAGMRGGFDLAEDFGVPEERVDTYDIATQLAMAAGLEALRDAGIPLVMNYRRTSKGTFLPERWKLPPSMQDETGVIFCSAFPGLDRMAYEAERYEEWRTLESQRKELRSIKDLLSSLAPSGISILQQELDRRLAVTEVRLKDLDYHLDRRFVFRVLTMGHAQFAEIIGARGPNAHVNVACASTTHALALAEDWIRAGRCRRVIVIAGDDITNPRLISWVGASLLASGAATTAGDIRQAAVPFDRRRNGMIMGMGAAALVVESEDAARERGVRAICEVLATQVANSAFHGTRLDVQHVSLVMERLLKEAEFRFGVPRRRMADSMVFVSHETYTPARGGSASAEIHALRQAFGDAADRLVITNTKGYTGHAMAVGIEDVLAVKALESGLVPPIPNISEGFEPDPELGNLNLSRGGRYDPLYALRLGAGFGSQVAMSLLKRIPGAGERIDREIYNTWLDNTTGYAKTELEIVKRTLRAADKGTPIQEPASSSWEYGQPPRAWASRMGMEGGAEEQRFILEDQKEISSESLPASEKESELGKTLPISENSAEIKGFLLALTSEKTGYPEEMLDLDLDLEADLGIDTVKQAELFSAVRTHFGIPRREDLRLADYNTLAKVIEFIQDGLAGNHKLAVSQETEGVPVKENEVKAMEIRDGMDPEVDAEEVKIMRHVLMPVLRPKLDLCVPSGAKSFAGKRVIVIKTSGEESVALVKELESRKVDVIAIESTRLAEDLEKYLRGGEVQGAYYLPALEADPAWDSNKPSVWKHAIETRLEPLYHLARALPESAFLVCATRMGGLHGLVAGCNPLGGLVSGFAKALSRERPGAFIKVVDFSPEAEAAQIARKLVAETLGDPAVVEVGWEKDLRFTPAMIEQALPSTSEPLREQSVFVVSGGTGGIVGRVLVDLAKATRGTFFLLNRTSLMEVDKADTERLRKDRNGLKAELARRLSEAGKKATPAHIDEKLEELERAAVALETVTSIEKLGGQVHSIACDITNAGDVEAAMKEIGAMTNRVDVLIHAAGLEKSRKLEKKPLDEFKRIVAVKAEGIINLLAALQQEERMPRQVVFFSSVAGRLGNAGQTDYSAANDFLSKLAGWLPGHFPGMTCVSIDWGAWAEVGMASRGHLPQLMQRAGIGMLPPEEAAPLVGKELQAGSRGEVVLAGNLGILAEKRHIQDGLDVERADAALRAGTPIHAMFSHLTGLDLETGISLEAELDPKEQAYLRDHALNGIPILPGVIGIEGFTVAAKHIASVLASDQAGFEVSRLEDIQFQTPFKFYRNESRHIRWRALALRQEEGLVVRAMLESDVLRGGRQKHMLHFSGRVYLSPNMPAPEIEDRPPHWSSEPSVAANDIYRLYFHGPTFQVLDSVQRSGDGVLGRLNEHLQPLRADEPELYLTPLLIELCFQTAGLWEAGTSGSLALPQAIGSLRIFPHKPIEGPVFAVVKPVSRKGRMVFDARVVDAHGYVYLELCDYSTVPLPYPAEDRLIEPLKVLAAPEPSAKGLV